MKQLLIALFTIVLYACHTVKPAASAVGLTTLNNYIINPTKPLHEDTTYMFFTNADDFNNAFSLTKSTPGNVTIPDFAGQAVAAIAIKPTTDILELKITKAEMAGEEMNIYYEVVKQPGTTYSQSTFVSATVPRAKDVKQVHFFHGAAKQKTLSVSF